MGFASTELSFHPCNILRDNRRGVSRGNKNVGCGTWKRHFFCTCGSNNWENVEDRWMTGVHAARGLASTELIERHHFQWPWTILSPVLRSRCLMVVKLEWLGYRMVKKLWRYVKPFSSDTGTLRTYGQTDGQICYIKIVCMRVCTVTCRLQ